MRRRSHSFAQIVTGAKNAEKSSKNGFSSKVIHNPQHSSQQQSSLSFKSLSTSLAVTRACGNSAKVEIPRCPIHLCAMQARREKVPFIDLSINHMRGEKRTVFFCAQPGCHRVQCGEQDTSHLSYRARAEERGHGWLVNL